MPDKASAGRIARSVRQRHKFTFTAHRWRKDRRFQNGEIVLQRTKLALMVPRLAESRTRYAYFFAGIACAASGAIGAIECINWHHRSRPHRRIVARPVAAGLGFGAGPREFCSRSSRVSHTGYPGWSGSCVAFWIEAEHEIVQQNFMRGGF